MTTVKEVRDALATYLEDSCGIPCEPRMPDQVNPPMMALLPAHPFVKYGITLGEGSVAGGLVNCPVEMNLTVLIIATKAGSTERAQEELDTYLGFDPHDDTVTSVPDALAGTTLNGLVEFIEPVQVSTYGHVEIAGQQYLSARIEVNLSINQGL